MQCANLLAKGLLLALVFACGHPEAAEKGASDPEPKILKVYSAEEGEYAMVEKVEKSTAEWKRELNSEQFRILREKGTEPAYSGRYHDHHAHGIYRCAGCGLDLFSSGAKYESGTGWPSFYRPVAKENILTRPDNSFFMRRTEVLCARCEGHLGHVFKDGPAPTGLRYCLNSAALEFEPTEEPPAGPTRR